jgi:hypothetical protein
MSFRGSCHCGRLAYTVDEEPPAKAMECNCSICRKKGALHHFTTPDKFHREAADEDIHVYQFNRHIIRHQYCKTCGCAPFAEGMSPKEPMVEINLRCAQGVGLDALEIIQFDGASL